jgi:hypothetical protein
VEDHCFLGFQAYRALSLVYHPDKARGGTGSSKKMAELSAAKYTLMPPFATPGPDLDPYFPPSESDEDAESPTWRMWPRGAAPSVARLFPRSIGDVDPFQAAVAAAVVVVGVGICCQCREAVAAGMAVLHRILQYVVDVLQILSLLLIVSCHMAVAAGVASILSAGRCIRKSCSM